MIETIFVPRGAEERAVQRGARRARSQARIVATGIGPRAAMRAAEEALADARFGTALVTGFCGALSPSFAVGDALVYREIKSPDGPALQLERGLADALARRVPSAQTGVRALASNAIVTASSEKIALGVRYAADAVDMESYALVERLARAGVAVAVLRVASDGAHDDLPDLQRALDGSGGLDSFALGLAFAREPLRAARFSYHAIGSLGALERAAYAALQG